MNLLFICSMNQWRSPTAEKIFQNLNGINTRSAGTSSKARQTVSHKDIKWADIIFVMESKHKQKLKADFRQEVNCKKIYVLDIPDDYKFMDEELVEFLNQTVMLILKEEKNEYIADPGR